MCSWPQRCRQRQQQCVRELRIYGHAHVEPRPYDDERYGRPHDCHPSCACDAASGCRCRSSDPGCRRPAHASCAPANGHGNVNGRAATAAEPITAASTASTSTAAIRCSRLTAIPRRDCIRCAACARATTGCSPVSTRRSGAGEGTSPHASARCFANRSACSQHVREEATRACKRACVHAEPTHPPSETIVPVCAMACFHLARASSADDTIVRPRRMVSTVCCSCPRALILSGKPSSLPCK